MEALPILQYLHLLLSDRALILPLIFCREADTFSDYILCWWKRWLWPSILGDEVPTFIVIQIPFCSDDLCHSTTWWYIWKFCDTILLPREYDIVLLLVVTWCHCLPTIDPWYISTVHSLGLRKTLLLSLIDDRWYRDLFVHSRCYSRWWRWKFILSVTDMTGLIRKYLPLFGIRYSALW